MRFQALSARAGYLPTGLRMRGFYGVVWGVIERRAAVGFYGVIRGWIER